MKLNHACRPSQPRQTQSGFAIILVMGLLLVAAAITATLMARQENETVWAPIEGTQDQMESVSKAIAAYERKNHRLPLPAARVAEGSLLLHKEATSLVSEEYVVPSSVSNALLAGATSVAGEGGIAFTSNTPTDAQTVVLIGAIPTETLGLPRSAAEDSYGRLLTYAVTLASSNPFTYEASEGAITLQDNDGNEVANKLSYIVIAHGKEGNGAWNAKSRVQGRGCDGSFGGGSVKDGGGIKGGGLEVVEQAGAGITGGGGSSGPVSDQANCDENDATFIVHDVTLVAGDEYFDDQLLRGKKDKIAQTISRPCAAQLVTWGKGDACQATIPAPGVYHYGSTLEPRKVTLNAGEVDDSITKTPANCVNGKCGGKAENEAEMGVIELPVETVTGSIDVTCDDGALIFGNATCVVDDGSKGGCTLDDGRFIEEGQCAPACVSSGKSKNCPAVENNNIRCIDGKVVSALGEVCKANDDVATSCSTPWGEMVAVNQGVQAYTGADAGSKECQLPVTYTCTEAKSGAPYFDPPMQAWTTNENPCDNLADCTAPWGASVSDGDSVTAYSDPVPCPPKQTCSHAISCNEEERICINGSLSGSLTNQACGSEEQEEAASCTTPWGATVADGGTVSVYGACDTGAKNGPACSETVRTCVNGSFDGAMKGDQSCSCATLEDGVGTIEVPCEGKGCDQGSPSTEEIDGGSIGGVLHEEL